jgi:hypothetical protein
LETLHSSQHALYQLRMFRDMRSASKQAKDGRHARVLKSIERTELLGV